MTRNYNHTPSRHSPATKTARQLKQRDARRQARKQNRKQGKAGWKR